MNRWRETELEAADAAIARATTGKPTVLVIEGEGGAGKSALIDELTSRAHGFQALIAEGFEAMSTTPFAVLSQFGITVDESLTPIFAAQRLRAALDGTGGPTLLVIDDLQWADSESVESVVALLSRAAGDQLLVCVGQRPLPASGHEIWRRWIARPGRAERLVLTGLDVDAAYALANELRPGLSKATAAALWEHTGGNPLYLRSVLTEFDDGALDQMRKLPAPAEFAATVAARLTRLSESARELAEALSVLGPGWVPLLDAAALAGSAQAVDELCASGLIEQRLTTVGTDLKATHGMIGAAIYHAIPAAKRRTLHLQAAQAVTASSAVLEHRLAAVEQYDEPLACELAQHAAQQRGLRAYRSAAYFLHAAARVSPDPSARERRWLDALFDDAYGSNVAAATAQSDRIARAADTRRRELVLGLIAMLERRTHDAVARLTPLSGMPDDDDEPVQHRVETLLAWTLLNTGAPEEAIQQALDRAATHRAEHPGIARMGLLVVAQLLARHADDPDTLPGLADLPENPHAVPPEATSLLAWRGLVRANTGRFASGIDDLGEVLERMQRGLHEFGGGVFHATLARAQWFTGDWASARRNLNLATELSGDAPHPMVLPAVPLIAVGDGDLTAADSAIALARDGLRRTPWPEAIDQLSMTEVIREHAATSPSPALYAGLAARVAAQRSGDIRKSVLWNLHAGLAAVWAGELNDAKTCAELMGGANRRTTWADALALWLRAVVAECTGDGKAALAHLRTAAAADLTAIPLYAAHVHLDHARLAHLMGDPTTANRSLDLASKLYHQLAAHGYVARVEELKRGNSTAQANDALALSDRERDVLALVSSGMSYAQIARDLFITQSTVSYHLGNIYAKANVGSRHQLTALVRAQPLLFGMAAQ